jgi:hypothetical protein
MKGEISLSIVVITARIISGEASIFEGVEGVKVMYRQHTPKFMISSIRLKFVPLFLKLVK